MFKQTPCVLWGIILVMPVLSPMQTLKNNHFDREKLQVFIYSIYISGSALKIGNTSWKKMNLNSEVSEQQYY